MAPSERWIKIKNPTGNSVDLIVNTEYKIEITLDRVFLYTLSAGQGLFLFTLDI